MLCRFFFFNDTATTEIYTLSLHDALPICQLGGHPESGDGVAGDGGAGTRCLRRHGSARTDRHAEPRHALQGRKSTRLNSSHANISYAVFCLKKTKSNTNHTTSET